MSPRASILVIGFTLMAAFMAVLGMWTDRLRADSARLENNYVSCVERSNYIDEEILTNRQQIQISKYFVEGEPRASK